MSVKLTLKSKNSNTNRCLLLVGGAGDTAERFQSLVDLLCPPLPDHAICTFSLSQKCEEGVSLLDTQANELLDVMNQLTDMHTFKNYDLFATSMGAYATVKVLLDPKYRDKIGKVIFFDPADYYLSDTFNDPKKEITWSGYQEYKPSRPVISDELRKYQGKAIIDVVHLVVRNHGPQGYAAADYSRRGEDAKGAYPRLSTAMVRKFYENTPEINRGEYTEIKGLPHGFFRDGNVTNNLIQVVRFISKSLGILL